MENAFDIGISDFFKGIIESTGGVSGKWASAMTTISGLYVMFFVVAVLLIFKKEYRVLGISMLVTMLISLVFNDFIFKKIFQRTRPYLYFGMEQPGFYVGGYSFPSGHSNISSAGAFSVLFYYLICNKRKDKTLLIWSIILLAIDVAVMFSRIALLHHYFTDCLAGCIEGNLFALGLSFATFYIVKLINNKKKLDIQL